MRELLAVVPLLVLNQPERPPVQYQGTDPITVSVTFADLDWVNTECQRRLHRKPAPGNVFRGCAGRGVLGRWIVLPHGCPHPDPYAGLVCHEVGQIRGWRHG